MADPTDYAAHGWTPFDAEPEVKYYMRDEAGRLLAVQVRTADKRIWWQTAGGEPGLGGVHLRDLLYRSERLRRVPLEIPVVVTEGPKDCDAVWRAGLPAVGTVTGAGGVPSPKALAVLRWRPVILWPDNDAAGQTHMERVADALVGIALTVSLLDPPGMPPKGGAFDVPADDIPRFVYAYARPYAGVGRTP